MNKPQNFPTVSLINGTSVNSAEYLDKNIGNAVVTGIFDANSKNVKYALEFDNGCMLPLIYPCCNRSTLLFYTKELHCPACHVVHFDLQLDHAAFTEFMIGFVLKSFFLKEEKKYTTIVLEFFKEEQYYQIPIVLKAVRMLFIPEEDNAEI